MKSIARRLGTNRSLVKKWLGREAKTWAGRSAAASQRVQRTQVVAAACQAPEQYGLQRLWSHSALSEALVESGLVEIDRARTVGLRQAQMPHRVKMWCHSEDPRFQEKLRDIVRLSWTLLREPVLCVDEKSGMQALSRLEG